MDYNNDRSGRDFTVRAFLAFKPSQEMIAVLDATQRHMARRGVSFKWVKPANIHLTIKFLGDISAPQVDRVGQAAATVVERAVPMTVYLAGLGVFPGWKRPRVLWAGLGGELERLGDFHGELDNMLTQAGLESDSRAFQAHLTIGRARRQPDPRALAEAVAALGEFPETWWSLQELILYKSELKPDGAVYSVLKRFPLTGQGGSASVRRPYASHGNGAGRAPFK